MVSKQISMLVVYGPLQYLSHDQVHQIVMKLLLIHMLKPILEIKRSTGNKTTCRDTHRANQKGLQ